MSELIGSQANRELKLSYVLYRQQAQEAELGLIAHSQSIAFTLLGANRGLMDSQCQERCH